MRNSKLLLVGIGLLLVGAIMISLYAGKAQAGITGSAHDLSATGPNGFIGQTQICIFCHTPHNAKTGVDNLAPLWNHTSTVGPFTLYGGGKTSRDTAVGQPGNVSKACLSCHDGTVAVDAYAGGTGTTTIDSVAKYGVALKGFIGTDLSNDHPIGLTYTGDAAHGLNTTPTTPLKLYTTKVECASCHDVHNYGTLGTTQPFLRMSKATSTICFGCHIK